MSSQKTRRSRVQLHSTVTLDIIPGVWYVLARAPKPATYYLTGKDPVATALCSLLPSGTLVATSKEIRSSGPNKIKE